MTGAAIALTLDGEPLANNRVFRVRAGSTLRMGDIQGDGVRSYLCLRGGFEVPDYLGSKAPLPSGSLAVTPDEHCAQVTCCICPH